MNNVYQVIKSKRIFTVHEYTSMGRVVSKGYPATLSELPHALTCIPHNCIQLTTITTTDTLVKKQSEQPKSKI